MKITLSSNKPKGGNAFSGSYKTGDKHWFLVEDVDGKRVTHKLEAGDRVFSRVFQPETVVSFEIPEGDNRILDFFKNHPHVMTEGYQNKNFKPSVPSFRLDVPDERVEHQYKQLQQKVFVVDKVRTLSYEDMIDLAFALGGNPRDKEGSLYQPKEVFTYLIGQQLDGLACKNVDRCISVWKLSKVEKAASVYAHKAIRYGIVSHEGGVYKTANVTLGSTIEQVIAHFKADADVFNNYIRPEVDLKEKEGLALREDRVFDPKDLPEDLRELLPAVMEKESAPKVTKSSSK